MPARPALTLLRLLNALRAIGVADATAWWLVGKCALDSMPANRRKALAYLMGRDAAASTSEVAEHAGYPTITARRALEDLTAHGVTLRQPGPPGGADLWEPTEWARGRWQDFPARPAGGFSENRDDMRTERENGFGRPVGESLISTATRSSTKTGEASPSTGNGAAFDPEFATDGDGEPPLWAQALDIFGPLPEAQA